MRFDEAQLAMFAADNASRMPNIKDELALAAGKVTPGVDDTPYIQYALQALVGGQSTSFPSHLVSGSSDGYSERYEPTRGFDESAGYTSPTRQDRGARENARPAPHRGSPSPVQQLPRRSTASFDPTGASSSRWVPVSKNMQKDLDPHGRTHPPLTFKPRILRAFSMAILAILILLMMAALIFSARYSYEHSGLTPYPGSIYSGQYFLFRILPQLLASIIFIYAQSVVSASLRVLPFAAMASEDPRVRYMALFQKLYPTSFLLPQFVGPWQFKLFDAATWLAIFTIPLQSAAFTCIFVHQKWIWAPVQAVVWALVGLYGILFLATVNLMIYWLVQWTGLAWDVRSIGDLLPLLNRSNVMTSYRRNDLAENANVFKSQLRDRWFDRLGYWKAEDVTTGGIWYAIGAPPDEDARFASGSMGKKVSNDTSVDLKEASYAAIETARGKYLPLCLRNGPILISVAVTLLLLVALVVVSFLPQTRLESGFLPRLSAEPDRNAFSPADFVFSFVPAMVGMLFFLQFQVIDLSLRTLQPWADLYDVNGSLAQRSLLADYAACLPLQSTWRALRNGHWRVAAVSLLATLFIFIPILGGGLLMALTAPDRIVRMYPSMPVFGVLLAFLFLYVGALALMVPHRNQFLLPRPITSIAGIISLCSAEELTQDAAFRSVRGRKDLENRLGVGRDDARDESSWFYGIVPGKDEHRLSVRRMNDFTEKLPRSSRSMAY